MDDTCQASPDLRKSGFRQENGAPQPDQERRVLADKTGEHCNTISKSAASAGSGGKKGGRGRAKTPSGNRAENQIKTGLGKGDSQEEKIAGKPTKERKDEKREKNGREEDFKDMTPVEQILLIRHKLEKIIHGREKEERKAINLLKLLERINLTESLIKATKINLTLEAMKFTIKNPEVRERTNKVLGEIKTLAVSKAPAQPVDSKDWRDPNKKAPEEDAPVDDQPVFSNLDFWMNKLMDTGKSLEVLDKQMENFSVTVKKVVPPTPPSKPVKSRSKSPTVDELLDTQNNNNTVESDLEALSKGLDNMLLKERKREEGMLKDKEQEGKEKERNISDEIDQICASVTGVTLNSKDNKDKLFSEPVIVKVKKENEKPSKENLEGESLSERIEAGKVKEKLISAKTFLDTKGVEDKESLLKHLEDLDSMKVTFDQLQSTKIGVSLNRLRKETSDSDILTISKRILRSWKRLIPKEPQQESTVAVNDKSVKTKEVKNEKTKDDIRLHNKKVLQEALRENKSLPERSWVSTEELAEAIEKAVFDMFADTNSKYRNQINSRVYNIRKNLTLQENLLIGNISPEEVAVMSHDDMASETLKKMRAELVKKGFQEVLTAHDPDDMFCTCRICLPPFLHA